MVKVCPPTLIDPFLDPPVFAAIEKLTIPLPVADAPEVIVIQDALGVAVQLQPAAVVTLKFDDPPAAGKLWFDGVILNVHGAA